MGPAPVIGNGPIIIPLAFTHNNTHVTIFPLHEDVHCPPCITHPNLSTFFTCRERGYCSLPLVFRTGGRAGSKGPSMMAKMAATDLNLKEAWVQQIRQSSPRVSISPDLKQPISQTEDRVVDTLNWKFCVSEVFQQSIHVRTTILCNTSVQRIVHVLPK